MFNQIYSIENDDKEEAKSNSNEYSKLYNSLNRKIYCLYLSFELGYPFFRMLHTEIFYVHKFHFI